MEINLKEEYRNAWKNIKSGFPVMLVLYILLMSAIFVAGYANASIKLFGASITFDNNWKNDIGITNILTWVAVAMFIFNSWFIGRVFHIELHYDR